MENLRGILLMTLAMVGFAVTDALLKALTGQLPIAQVIMMLGTGGFAIFAVAVIASGQPLLTRDALRPVVIMRNLAEGTATASFVTALSLIPLSTASAILQANPLFVTMGAALFLGEAVGWRRWLAIGTGFCGMLMILRPITQGLDWGASLAVLAMLMLTVRDVSTKVMPKSLSTLQIAAYAFVSVFLTGVLMLPFGPSPVVPNGLQMALMLSAIVVGPLAYYAITASMRIGEMSAITPFRYTRLVFAMGIAILVLGERPDSYTLLGAAIIIASGLYTFARERKRRSAEKL